MGGQGKNIVIDGFEYNNHRYNYTGAYGNVIIKVRRADNSNASGTPCELFAVKYNNNNIIPQEIRQNNFFKSS